MIAHTRKVANTSSAHQDYRVFLKIVINAGDIRGNFLAIGQTNPSYLPQRGVRLLGSLGLHDQADRPALRPLIQVADLGLLLDLASTHANKLINRRHLVSQVVSFVTFRLNSID